MGARNGRHEVPSNPIIRDIEKQMARDKERKKHMKNQKKLRAKQEKNKKKHDKKRSSTDSYKARTYGNAVQKLEQNEFERAVTAKLRSQIENHLSLFILNQISFGLQFFTNYESERTRNEIYNENLEREKDLNKNLEQHSILLLNALDKSVEKSFVFKPKHGLNKLHESPLQLQKLYIVFENIEISKPNEANYDSITPICKVDLDSDFNYQKLIWKDKNLGFMNPDKKGFTRLKLKQTNSEMYMRPSEISFGKNNHNMTSSAVAANEFLALRAHNKLIYKPRSSSSSAYGTDSEYDYPYIIKMNTHHPLGELTMRNSGSIVDTNILPHSCITDFQEYLSTHDIRTVQREDQSDNDESADYSDEEEDDDHHPYKDVLYLNSKEFLCYFADLLRQTEFLDLHPDELTTATYKGASIFTRSFEIIPAIHAAQHAKNWPSCAYGFKNRRRNVTVNKLTGDRFQWPTPRMIERVESFGYHVIPVSYTSKMRKNPLRELEWKIVFPKAERFLECNMTNAQIKIFLLFKLLLKSFLNAENDENLIHSTIDFVRTYLFWEIERDFVAWPEQFLGEVLLRCLRGFHERLTSKMLPDFFISSRNLFECMPDSMLSIIKSILHSIIDNPTIYLIVAYRNLAQVDQDILPKINYRRVFTNMSSNSFTQLKLQTRHVVRRSVSYEETKSTGKLEVESENIIKNVGLIGKASITNKQRTPTRKLREQIEKKKILEESKRPSVDSINLEFVFNHNLNQIRKTKDFNPGLENLRRTNILEIFIENFLCMAEKLSIPYKSINLAQFYLNQALKLCEIYRDLGCDNSDFLAKKDAIMESISILRSTEDNLEAPALPIRTSFDPICGVQSKRNSLSRRFSKTKKVVTIDQPMSKLDGGTFQTTATIENVQLKSIIRDPPVLPEMETAIKVNGGISQRIRSFSEAIMGQNKMAIEFCNNQFEGRKSDFLRTGGSDYESILYGGGTTDTCEYGYCEDFFTEKRTSTTTLDSREEYEPITFEERKSAVHSVLIHTLSQHHPLGEESSEL